MDNVTWDLKADKAVKLIKEGKRVDDRALDQYRAIEIKKNISENAEGSALVKLGGTEVVVGVKMVLGEPYPDMPNEGTISVGAELLPLASPVFEFGPPRPESIELARVVDRAVRESKALDFKDLCIEEGEKVWIVFIDLYALNDDGNLFDACSIATLSSLLETRIPKLEDGEIIKDEYSGKLKLSRKPLLCTFSKIAGKIVVDPVLIEEKAHDARFSLATTEDNYMCAFQKGGSGSLTESEIDQCIDTAFKCAKQIRKQL